MASEEQRYRLRLLIIAAIVLLAIIAFFWDLYLHTGVPDKGAVSMQIMLGLKHPVDAPDPAVT